MNVNFLYLSLSQCQVFTCIKQCKVLCWLRRLINKCLFGSFFADLTMYHGGISRIKSEELTRKETEPHHTPCSMQPVAVLFARVYKLLPPLHWKNNIRNFFMILKGRLEYGKKQSSKKTHNWPLSGEREKKRKHNRIIYIFQ